jgi:predicted secreted protein
MQIGSAIALYFVIWWLTLFAVLPFGVRSQHEAGEVVAGSDPGAPAKVRIRRVVILNSVVALVMLALFWIVYVENWLGLSIIDDISRR